jgi:hypothetical protein
MAANCNRFRRHRTSQPIQAPRAAIHHAASGNGQNRSAAMPRETAASTITSG